MASQGEKIVDLLLTRGNKGATNIELNKISFRYSARIFNLRKEGYDIRKQHLTGSIWKYWLQEGK